MNSRIYYLDGQFSLPSHTGDFEEMKNKVLLIAAAMLVSVAVADTADAGIFRNRCGVARTPVRNVVRGTACVVGRTLHFGARVVTAPVRAVRNHRCYRMQRTCNGGWVQVETTNTSTVVAPSPTAVRSSNAVPLEVAPSPPQ